MMAMGRNMVKELIGAFPGIDEAMSFAEVMRYEEQNNYSKSWFFPSLIATKNLLARCMGNWVGAVVEHSPPTNVARIQFPDSAS